MSATRPPDPPAYDPIQDDLDASEIRRQAIAERILSDCEDGDEIVQAAIVTNLHGRREGWREVEVSARKLAAMIDRGVLPYLAKHLEAE